MNSSPAGWFNRAAAAGSSNRDSAATRRSMPTRSRSSSRPKDYSTSVRDVRAAGSHSL
jgi:hypothetical protein